MSPETYDTWMDLVIVDGEALMYYYSLSLSRERIRAGMNAAAERAGVQVGIQEFDRCTRIHRLEDLYA
jgi:hypothetical protein